MAKKAVDVGAKFLARERMLAKARAGYHAADELLAEIMETVRPGQTVVLPHGKTAVIIDLFDGKNKVFKNVAVPRYDVKISDNTPQ